MWWLAVIGCSGGDPTDDRPAPTDATEETGTPPTTDPACAGHLDEAWCDGDDAVTCDADGRVVSQSTCDHGCVGGACVSCDAVSLQVALSNEGATAVVEVDGAGRRPRAVHLTGTATLSVDGPFRLLRTDGTDLPATPQTDVDALVVADDVGAGTLTATVPGCSQVTVPLVGVPPTPLVGQTMDQAPWFETAWDLFNGGSDAQVLVDPDRYADRVGMTFDAVLVPHRSAAEWASDPGLGSATATVGGSVDGHPLPVPIPVPAAGTLLEGWDLVIDFGRDGRLDPGDLLDGLDTPAFQAIGDLSEPGPYTPRRGDVDVANDTWLHQVVYAPVEIGTLGTLPLVVISHGNGHDYHWYDWLGNHLASWGYVVMSHKNNTMPGPRTAATTTLDNVDYLLGHLGTELGGVLDGHVDPHTQIWIGHSRGGEGVVLAYDRLFRGTATPANYDLSDIVMVSSIAPTIFEGPDAADPHDVAYHLLAGSSDGDVTGSVGQATVQYFRIFQRATGLNLVTYVQGADHNDFNCCGAEDSAWAPSQGPLIGREAAQRLARVYYLATIEALVRGQDALWEIDQRPLDAFRPVGIASPVATQLKRGQGDRKLVVDDFQRNTTVDLSSSGGSVSGTVRDLSEGKLDDPDRELSWRENQPMNGMTWSSNDADPARGAVFGWDDGDDVLLDFELPAAAADLHTASAVSMRVCQRTRNPSMVRPTLDFGVALVDGAGHETEVPTAGYGGVVRTYERGGSGNGVGWVNEFQTLRIPITGFVGDPDLDLTDVRTVRLRFGAAHGSPHGRVGLDDLEILTEATP
ncbi:MAG: hypothetical protein H6738_11420 [Alphaproteobacteria bacterium]|nr:hypothetical protein [Alphaproteobacteria bacterium]MCB9697380.1 hypothetical protein [Alphaproteobacteria bacterium]